MTIKATGIMKRDWGLKKGLFLDKQSLTVFKVGEGQILIKKLQLLNHFHIIKLLSNKHSKKKSKQTKV